MVKSIFAKINNDSYTFANRQQLILKYKNYNNINSLQMTIYIDTYEINLSLLSIFYFITTGSIIQRMEK